MKLNFNEGDAKLRQKQQKNINDFAQGSESEREEEEIYSHYMNELKKT